MNGNPETRTVLILADNTRRIFGSECRRVFAVPDLDAVDLRVGVNGHTSTQTFHGVTHVFYEGRVTRLVRKGQDGNLTLEYPRSQGVIEYSLSKKVLEHTPKGSKTCTVTNDVQALMVE